MIDKIELTFIKEYVTERAIRFREKLGEVEWSDQGVAIGPLYVKKQALEEIGSPEKIKVTIEPMKEE